MTWLMMSSATVILGSLHGGGQDARGQEHRLLDEQPHLLGDPGTAEPLELVHQHALDLRPSGVHTRLHGQDHVFDCRGALPVAGPVHSLVELASTRVTIHLPGVPPSLVHRLC
jgi:hypothetical protein